MTNISFESEKQKGKNYEKDNRYNKKVLQKQSVVNLGFILLIFLGVIYCFVQRNFGISSLLLIAMMILCSIMLVMVIVVDNREIVSEQAKDSKNEDGKSER